MVDRIIKKEGYRSRLADSLETGLKLTGGEVIVENLNEKQKSFFLNIWLVLIVDLVFLN